MTEPDIIEMIDNLFDLYGEDACWDDLELDNFRTHAGETLERLFKEANENLKPHNLEVYFAKPQGVFTVRRRTTWASSTN